LFEGLKKRSCFIAITTTYRTGSAKLTMHRIGVEDSIDFIVGIDLVKKLKPATDLMNLIAKGR